MSENSTQKKRTTINPIVILLGILLFATSLTYLVSSGSYDREGKLVKPGTYQVLDKEISPSTLFRTEQKGQLAHPVSLPQTLVSIPKGLAKSSGLIFMVLIIGGMFGIVKATGAIDIGLEQVVSKVKGNVYILVAGLTTIFSAGSTFLGLASEYLLIIPVMVAMAKRMGLSAIIGLAIVTVGVKVGYIASVTNPIPLTIAQPLVGLPIFSGASTRFVFYLIFLTIGIGFLIYMVHREGYRHGDPIELSGAILSHRQKIMLAILTIGIGVIVYASSKWQWKHEELSAFYIGLSILLAACSGLGASQAADAFVSGMKKILLATFLIGVATAVSVVLQEGMILDTIVYHLTSIVSGSGAGIAAVGMFVSQFLLDFLIPSTSGQAAVSMPILGPIGQLTGVSGQTTVLAFLYGNALTNMITPTSGTLLAYLATAEVSWITWAKFIFPLFIIFGIVSIILLNVSVAIGF